MKLVVYQMQDSARGRKRMKIGALVGNGEWILDFDAALDEQASKSRLNAYDVLERYDMDGEWFTRAQRVYSDLNGNSQMLARLRQSGVLVDRAVVELLAPVPRPGKIICIGLNYRDHAIESNMPIPESPVIFSKFATSVTAPGVPVVLPRGSSQVDYEAELAFVVGRRAKHVRRDEAYNYVLGYTNFNDLSARDFQFADKQWQRGKACDGFAPMGEYIATVDEIPDPQNLSIKLRLNGETMQDSRTDQLIFGVPELIEFLSAVITLEPGDVVATGTPPGVGFARNPPVFLKDGDRMEVEIEGLGVLTNEMISEGR